MHDIFDIKEGPKYHEDTTLSGSVIIMQSFCFQRQTMSLPVKNNYLETAMLMQTDGTMKTNLFPSCCYYEANVGVTRRFFGLKVAESG